MWGTVATEASEEVASRLVAEIQAVLEPLRYFPFAGVARKQFAAHLRVIFHGAWAIYYVPRREVLVIVRVLRAARDATALPVQDLS